MCAEPNHRQQIDDRIRHLQQNNQGLVINRKPADKHIFIKSLKTGQTLLFGLTYLEKFEEYSLTIDLDKDGSLVYSIWNPFPTLDDMMNRIFRLIDLFNNKEYNLQ